VKEVVKINAICHVSFQVSTQVLMEELFFTFIVIKVLFFSMWHLPDARLARLSPQSVLFLGYHVFWAAALVTMERQQPLQTLHNQFFNERLQINMAACSATLVGLSAATMGTYFLSFPYTMGTTLH
jgi:hypothetical protein